MEFPSKLFVMRLVCIEKATHAHVTVLCGHGGEALLCSTLLFYLPVSCRMRIVEVINVSVGWAPIGKLLKKGLAQEHICRELPQLGFPSKLLPGVWYRVSSPGTT